LKHKTTVIISAMLLGLFVLGLSNTPAAATESFATRYVARTTESYQVDSPHYYPNNYDNTWTITKADASKIRVFFRYLRTETNYDFVYVYDKNWNQLARYHGTQDNTWSPYSNFDTIYVRLVTDYSVTKWGFRITQIDYELGGGGGGGGELTDGETVSSSLGGTGETEMWYIDVGANCESMYSVLTCGSSDYDLYGRLGAEPTTSTYDWRGYTGGGEEVTYNNPGEGRWYIMVRSYSGSGAYELTVSLTYASSDTVPPTVSITNPANGATVSGTVSVTASASDNVGVTEVRFYIDGTYKATDSSSPYSYSWDTTGYSDGSHTVRATAYDAAGNNAYDQHTVTVSNGGGGGNELQNGVPVTSSLAAVHDTEMWTIEVAADATSMHSVLTCGSADFDLYGRLGAEPTTSVYDWRGYTSGGEDVSYANPGEGTWYIMVRSYSGTGAYELTVTITYGGGGGGDWGDGGKYAILVGISDYQSISDLSYCDEDATDWYNYLTGQGYECHVYGDGHTSNYPRHDGYATESVVRAAILELLDHAQPGDHVVFATSGHGSGNGAGSSYLCMYDCSGSAGCYYDTEIRDDFSNANGEEIFIFIDHCYSGGIGPDLSSIPDLYCCTTCTEDGYGYDDSSHHNGMWTYWFLEAGLIGHFGSSSSTTMEEAFDWAAANYPYQPPSGDAPMEFDYNTGDTTL
jgi:hypothetical protein